MTRRNWIKQMSLPRTSATFAPPVMEARRWLEAASKDLPLLNVSQAAPTAAPPEPLRRAMAEYPEMVSGEREPCTELMRAMDGRVAIKTGADAVFVAIIPERKMGVALKIADGTMRAAECAIAHILIGLGVLDEHHPAAQTVLHFPHL